MTRLRTWLHRLEMTSVLLLSQEPPPLMLMVLRLPLEPPPIMPWEAIADDKLHHGYGVSYIDTFADTIESLNVFGATVYVISRTTASEAAVRSAAGFAGPEAIVDVVAS